MRSVLRRNAGGDLPRPPVRPRRDGPLLLGDPLQQTEHVVRLIQGQQSQLLRGVLPRGKVCGIKVKGIVVHGLGNAPNTRPVTYRAPHQPGSPWKGRLCVCRCGNPLVG